MSNIGTKKKEFVGYEYKEVAAESSKASFLVDGYECFGWEMDENLSGNRKSGSLPNQKKIMIRLKRNRKIINKMELNRLQRNFEACVSEIEILESSKTSVAAIYALAVGIVGTAFIAGSTFAVVVQPPHIVLCIVLAIPGFFWVDISIFYL